MHYAHTIILTIVLVTFFCIFFGWCLMRSCRRVIDAEMQDLAEQRAHEAPTVVSSAAKTKTKSGKGSKASDKQSKASGKSSKVRGSSGAASQKWGDGSLAKNGGGIWGAGAGAGEGAGGEW